MSLPVSETVFLKTTVFKVFLMIMKKLEAFVEEVLVIFSTMEFSQPQILLPVVLIQGLASSSRELEYVL